MELLLKHEDWGAKSWKGGESWGFGKLVRNALLENWNGGMVFGNMEKSVGNGDRFSEAR